MRYIALLGLAALLLAAPATPSRPVNFQREIRPILSDNCFACHGPDKNTRLADLRLDTREGAFTQRPNGTPILAGKPAESLVYRRITADKPALLMPPVQSHKKLSPQQKDLIRLWIEQGADWKQHWSFVPASKPQLPPVKAKAWVRNPIDQFVLARLEAAGLQPAPPADRRSLIRRLALDLTGLPPKPAEVEVFAADQSPNAYSNLVERLLTSPQWGEHRGRYWLDYARYADTHGLHIDNYREMWPYRDWVIQAFNRNLPFDQFTIEQIAGDLLPNRTLDQQVASGFNRCNITTNEGGAIPEEVDAIYQKDRVETTATVFLGLTMGCAVCHDHKFDPLQQKEFYQMVAFFKNTTQKPMDGNVYDTPPIIVVPTREERSAWQELDAKEKVLRARKQDLLTSAPQEWERWRAAGDRFTEPVDPADQGFALNSSLSLTNGVTWGPGNGENHTALHFAEKAGLEVPAVAGSGADKPFSISAWVYMPKGEDNFTIASRAQKKGQFHGWLFEIQARIPMFRLNGTDNEDDEQKRDRLLVRGPIVERLKPGNWYHLAASYDGSREQDGLSLYINGRLMAREGRGESSETLRGDFDVNEPLRIGWNGGRTYFDGGAVEDLRLYRRVLLPEEVEAIAHWPAIEAAWRKGGSPEREPLLQLFLSRRDTTYRDSMTGLAAIAAERRAIRQRGGITHVMHERDDSKPMAHVLFRGMYDQPREQVEPGVPSALPPMTASMPRNRLGLAHWLVDPANPLTARVTVNRFWQEVFGTGIVKTSEDFGTQGEPPSHLELLDWLAIEFRQKGWDIRELFRLIVHSNTYRQAAVATEEKQRKDPDNRLLSRGPRFRMDAEMVRDYALAASGLLAPRVGGPSVKPYQPGGVWETVAMLGSNTRFYRQDSGDKLYRRSMYTFWKRSAPPASMEIFNATTRENCTVRRERTNTPLQALVTLNDPQFVEAARHLAQRSLLQPGASFDQRLDFLTEHVLARRFDRKERAIIRSAFDDLLVHYEGDSEAARKVIRTGESAADASLAPPEFAAWTMVASQIMNLDEALNK